MKGALTAPFIRWGSRSDRFARRKEVIAHPGEHGPLLGRLLLEAFRVQLQIPAHHGGVSDEDLADLRGRHPLSAQRARHGHHVEPVHGHRLTLG